MARSLLVKLAAASLLVGCSQAASGPPGEVKLGVDVAALDTAKAAAVIDAAVGDSDGGGITASPELVLTRVRLLMSTAKIGYTGGGDSDGPSAEIGPLVVDLTADEIANGAHREFSLGELPGGTYGGAEIEIEPLAADQMPTDATFTDFVASKASVLVDGTYGGKAFSFAGHFLAEQGTDGEVTVDASTPVTLAMTVDPSGWFVASDGAVADPTDAAQHDALAVAICKTLDTQPQTGGPSTAPAGAPQSKGHGGDGDGDGPKGGGHGHGGGGDAHCVESAP